VRALAALALALPAGIGAGCGDNRAGEPADAPILHEASVDAFMGGSLFGEACTQPPFPEIGGCHLGEGACLRERAREPVEEEAPGRRDPPGGPIRTRPSC